MAARGMRRCAIVGALLLGGALVVLQAPAPAGAAVFDQRWAQSGAGMHRASPTFGDLSVGRVALVADMGGSLRALRADGSVAWAAGVDPRPGSVTAVEGAPAVGDLDGDGQNEVVVGAGSSQPSTSGEWGGVVAFNGNGTTRWRFLTDDVYNVYTGGGRDGRSDGVFSSPAIGDVDGDGRNDVVFGSWDHKIYALHGDGSMVSGFPVDNTDTVFSSPALFDLDDDGRLEIVIGGDQSRNPAVPPSFAGGILRVLDVAGGRVTQRTRGFNDILASSPAIGDIDGDGREEAVFTTGNYYHASESRRVWAVHLDDLSDVAGWPKTTSGELFGSPALGDVVPGDGGRPEVVVGDLSGNVYAWRGNGAQVWAVAPGPNGRTGFYGGPSVGDLDGDGRQDVAIGYGFGGALLLRGSDGALIRRVGGTYASLGTPAIIDFGGGARRLVVGGWDPRDGSFGTGQVAAYELPAGTADWPVFRKNPRHLGAPVSGGNPLPPGFCSRSTNPPSNPSPASGRGYWFLTQDGGVLSFDVPYYGNLPGLGVNEGGRAMASRPQGDGYWVVSRSGRVFAFGGAPDLGDLGGEPLNSPIIRLMPTPTGRGYWLLAGDGGIFSFGDARFHGSTGGITLRAPVIGMGATATGGGYWLVASDGGVFTFGDAVYRGSAGNLRLASPIVSMAVRPDGAGYWLLGADGGVFSYGVPFYGSVPGTGACSIAASGVQMQVSKTGLGYWMVASDGGVFSFGDAAFHGSRPGLSGPSQAVDLAVG